MLDLGSTEKVGLVVKVDGKEYPLREPTVDDVEFLVSNENSEHKGMKGFLLFAERLGLPMEVAKKLSLEKVKMLSDALVPSFDQKKS